MKHIENLLGGLQHQKRNEVRKVFRSLFLNLAYKIQMSLSSHKKNRSQWML